MTAAVLDPRRELSPSARLVHRLAALLERRPRAAGSTGPTRRSFLARAALVGSALATNPVSYLLRPGSAYAQTTGCGGGNGCGTGWTVFCVTVAGNRGKNTCPPGSFAAGWWKADNSAFCQGRARYYIDCNRLPSSPGSCSCVNCYSQPGSCDQRRYCCNAFRYGQCNTHIGGVTPVVCRVITCTPPWEWGNCTTTSRTDNRTATHTAPELAPAGASALTIKYQDLGLLGSFLGARSGGEYAIAGGLQADFANGSIVWSGATGAHAMAAFTRDRWSALGGSTGRLGFPTVDDRAVGDGRGQQTVFQRGRIYWTPTTGAHDVLRPVLDEYLGRGGPIGALGYPIANTEASGPARVRVRFEHGTIDLVRFERFVESAYRVVLRRMVDPGGLAGWVAALEGGTSRAAIAQALLDSAEGRARQVEQAYLTYLGRPADTAGRNAWAAWLATNSWRDLALNLLGSAEAWRSGGSTAEGFVELLYQRVLGHASSPQARAVWAGYLAANGQLATVAGIFDSTEAIQRRVDSAFRTVLGRGADPGGLNAYTTITGRFGDKAVVHELLSSAEFYNRGATAPFGILESAQRLSDSEVRVRGWAIDPEVTSAAQVQFSVDGAAAGSTTANLARADVGAANPGYGNNHGFDVTISFSGSGPHEICAFAVDASSGGRAGIGCRSF